MDKVGGILLEFVMMLAVVFIMVCMVASYIGESQEVNLALAAARSGATQGANLDSMAIYPDQSFSNYSTKNQRLLFPSHVQIIKIEYKKQDFSSVYQKTKIQIRVYARDPSLENSDDKNCMGERINYYVRKGIAETFKTEYMTNIAFNPAFSSKYYYTTADVNWS
ncbi:MAG TPA: hypothetical protein VK444_07605 [Methanobacteriaceae archaeon]|nr:hypothetical protein [Methanobacteriaceae archaeon]